MGRAAVDLFRSVAAAAINRICCGKRAYRVLQVMARVLQVMEPLDPLAAQKRKGLLSSIRCVAKFPLAGECPTLIDPNRVT